MLQACFILLAITLAIILYLMAAKVALMAIPEARRQKVFIRRAATVIVCWLVYISVLSVTGLFTNPSFPPRIPLLLVAPAFLFFIYFFTHPKFKTIIAHTPPAWPVFFQSFRIVVELLIWWLFMQGVLPQSATFDGHNFDILIGLTAPLVAYFTFTRKVIGKTLFVIWNVTGLATLGIVVIILMRHTYLPSLQNSPDNILSKGFGAFPYTFLAGLFMPLAVFLHIFSLAKMRKGNRGS